MVVTRWADHARRSGAAARPYSAGSEVESRRAAGRSRSKHPARSWPASGPSLLALTPRWPPSIVGQDEIGATAAGFRAAQPYRPFRAPADGPYRSTWVAIPGST